VRVVKPAPAGSIDAHLQGSTSTFDQIDANGAAAKAGLQVGDQVTAVDGASVTDMNGYEVMQVITQRPPGTAAALTIVRGDAALTIKVSVHA
ncbi:MAG TPA: PDZ domain-containing protein, partial [Kofleriaceae bacterium]